MVKIEDVYKSTGNYLKSSDLKEPTKYTITAVRTDTIGNQIKLVMQFKETAKIFVVNPTNARIIAERLGNETDRWVNSVITIAKLKVQFKGDLVDGIRVL